MGLELFLGTLPTQIYPFFWPFGGSAKEKGSYKGARLSLIGYRAMTTLEVNTVFSLSL